MIDERQEELAALYALDLLEGSERAQFETALVRDPALQALVRDLRESSSALARTAPALPPPAALKDRVLASAGGSSAPATTAPGSDNIIRTSAFGLRTFLPWAIAACFAVVALVVGQRYQSSQNEVALLRTKEEIVDVALQAARNQLEAERLLNSRAVTGLNRDLTDGAQKLAAAEQALTEARDRIAALNLELKSQADIADLKITALASMLDNSPEALAVAIWDPVKQEGVLKVEKLPALAADQRLELWVIEDKANAQPVSAGVFHASDGGRLNFKPVQPVSAIAAFAISREKNDGARSHAAPGEVVMLGK